MEEDDYEEEYEEDYEEDCSVRDTEMLTTRRLQHCCGVIEIGPFSSIYEVVKDQDGRVLTKEEKLQKVDGMLGNFVKPITISNYNYKTERYETSNRKRPAFIITLAGYQWKDIEPILFKHGFKEDFQFFNPNSGNNVKLYSFIEDGKGNKYV